MRKTWLVREDAPPPALAQETGLSELTIRLLWRRGYRSPESIRRFMNPSVRDIEDPGVFTDMPRAVSRIREAVRRNEKMLIYGDYDVDGITGSAILFRTLREMGAVADVCIPHRVRDGYGLKRSALEGALKKDTRLVVTVDNGITGAAEVDFLVSKKIDVIIVDHHEPQGGLPNALAILSPQRKKTSEPCGLAACGLAFKLAWALREDWESVKSLMDLVALGTIADMAPLRGENRALVRWGLAEIGATSKKGLRALRDRVKPGGRAVTSEDVGYGLAPRLNAAGRIGSAEDAFRLLVTEDELEAENLARILDESNAQRRKIEREAFVEAVEQAEREHHFGRDRVIVVASDRWHEGIAGILATRLVERFHRPSFVISVREGVGKGSGRSIPSFVLFSNLERCAGLFDNFGGHSHACGLVIQEKRIPEFRQAINRIAHEALRPEQLALQLEIDGVAPLSAFDEKILKELERFEPFGMGNPPPLFLSRGLRVKTESRSVGRSGSAFWVEDPSDLAAAEATSFRQKYSFAPGSVLDLVHRPVRSEWRGVPVLELRTEDVNVLRTE